MNYNIDDVIKFKDGEYLVIDVIKNEGNTYLYLINNDEYLNDVSITKRKITNKLLTPYRDNVGRFSSDKNSRAIYHEEFVHVTLEVEKSNALSSSGLRLKKAGDAV